jgi:hypothetical protein
MEERAREWRAGGTDRPHQQTYWPPPWPYFSSHLVPSFHTHNSPENLTFKPLQCSLRERKLRKKVEKKSQG